MPRHLITLMCVIALSFGLFVTNVTAVTVPVPAGSASHRQLSSGKSGQDVFALQQFLKDRQFYATQTTGYFGVITRNAVIAFQKKYGIDPLGFVGPKTWMKIDELSKQPVASVIVAPSNSTRCGVSECRPQSSPLRGGSSQSVADTRAPVESSGSPAGTLPLGTTSTTLSLSTNETATCAYSTSSGTAYTAMTLFTTTAGLSHSENISGLTNGGSYVYYIKCQDSLGNTNTSDYTISFTVAADVTAPTVSITTPSNSAVVGGSSVTVTASASDDVSVVGVQFKRDGSTNIGSEDTSSPYTISWDTTALSDGSHTLTAVARDGSGNSTTSAIITITVDNTAPVISSISSGTPSATGATITWSTDEGASTQVDYGLTGGYGTTTTLDSSLVTSHTVSLTGLSSARTYHYRVRSVDSLGHSSVSGDNTFTTLQPAWVPVASSVVATSFSDFTTEGSTNHYWYSGAIYDSASAHRTASNQSFTRNSSAYYTNSSGVLTAALTNILRFDYDPVGLILRGILTEGTTTNTVAPSESAVIGWTKTNSTVTESATTAPDGTSTAMKLVESAATGLHSISETASYNLISVYAKAGERTWAYLDANDGSTHYTYFDLSNGVVGTNAAGNTASITAQGNGWYLITVRRASSTSAKFGVASADSSPSYAGDTLKGIYLWGMNARIFDAGTPDSYIKTSSQLGALIGYWNMDETGTGTRADSTANGWTLTNNNGVTNATGILGNASSFTRASSMYLSRADTALLHPTSSFGVSVWVKFNSFANYQDLISKWDGLGNNDFTLEVNSAGNVGFYVAAGSHSAQWGSALSTGTWYNIVAWHDSVNGQIGITVNNGTPVTTAYSGGLTPGGAQLQIGAANTAGWTSYTDGLIDEVAYFSGTPNSGDRTFIYGGGTPPAYASWPASPLNSPTRSADVLVRTIPSSPAAITKVISARTPHMIAATSSFQILYHFDDDSEGNDFEAYRDSTGHIFVDCTASGVPHATLDMGFVANDTNFKIAFRGSATDVAASLNGGSVQSDSSVVWPVSFTKERWGTNQLGIRQWNSTISSDTTFLTAVSDSDLQSLSQ